MPAAVAPKKMKIVLRMSAIINAEFLGKRLFIRSERSSTFLLHHPFAKEFLRLGLTE